MRSAVAIRDAAGRDAPSLIIPGSLTMNVLPRSFMAKLRYAETFSLTTGAAGIIGSVQVMTLNNIYDPNQSGTGHQPYGFDQLAAFYGYFVVHHTKWRLLATTIGGTPEVCLAYQLYPAVSGVTIAGISTDAATEKAAVTTLPVGPSGVDRARMIQGESDIWKILGITKQQYLDNLDQYGAAVTTGPTVGAYLEFGIGSYSGNAGETLSVQVVMDFDVEFYSPKTLPQS